MDVSFQVGIPEHSRLVAAELYDEAFGRKLQVAIPDDSIRKAVFVAGMDLQRGIAALDEDGALVGLAGFHDAGGSLTGLIDFKILRDHIGLGGAIRAFFVFALLDRKPEKGELLMDGIVVSERARGRGIGSGLFSALEEYAVGEGLRTIRLDVIDTNPGARRLYERLGFEPTKTEKAPFLGKRMGFESSTTMVKQLG